MPDDDRLARYRAAVANYEPPDDEPIDPEVRAAAVAACDICDDEGYRANRVCDHEQHSTAEGRAKARALFEAGRKTLADTVHAAGETVPNNLTPPSERMRKVQNRADRRQR